jgi:hypothetical protein
VNVSAFRRSRAISLYIAIAGFIALLAGGYAGKSSSAARTAAHTAGQVLWGAYMEGSETYAHYYGNPAPNGSDWENAPWGGSGNTWDRFERDAGKRVSVDEYGQPPPWLQGFAAGTADLVIRRGAIPAIGIDTSIGPRGTVVNDQQVADGKYDTQITSWFRAARHWRHPFFLVMDAEMNGNWEGYSPGHHGNTAASFVAMWRHMHDLAAAAGASNVTWVWCPNVDPGHLFTPYSKVYPGGAYVDWTGMDGFNRSGRDSFDALFRRSYGDLLTLAPSKPIFISQTASVDGSGKARWIADMLRVALPQRFPQIRAFVWFNWRIHESGVWWSWPIESSQSAMSAFRAGISSHYYATNTFENLPPLTKVKPLWYTRGDHPVRRRASRAS